MKPYNADTEDVSLRAQSINRRLKQNVQTQNADTM